MERTTVRYESTVEMDRRMGRERKQRKEEKNSTPAGSRLGFHSQLDHPTSCQDSHHVIAPKNILSSLSYPNICYPLSYPNYGVITDFPICLIQCNAN